MKIELTWCHSLKRKLQGNTECVPLSVVQLRSSLIFIKEVKSGSMISNCCLIVWSTTPSWLGYYIAHALFLSLGPTCRFLLQQIPLESQAKDNDCVLCGLESKSL